MTAIRFEAGDVPPADPVVLDPSQQAVLALGQQQSAAVVGAPGSGKTTTLVELVADRVLRLGWAPDEVLVIAASRRSATVLRDRLARRLAVITTGPLARTAASVAFEAVTARARAEGAPSPRLLSGADQDLVLRDLLAGHLADHGGPEWPAHLDAGVRRMPAFRTELRELMMRATEHGVAPARLRELGRQEDRPEWVAAADFLAEYHGVLASASPDTLDPAELMAFAERAVADGLAGERLGGLRLVIVDDLQQVTEGTIRLLRAFADRGAAVVGFGDPDLAVNSFRGGEADAVGTLRSRLGRPDAPQLVLDSVHRHGPAIRAATVAVTERVGTAGEGTQRRAASVVPDPDAGAGSSADGLACLLEPSPTALTAAVGRVLRERHLLDGVPWAELAVVVRNGRDIPGLVRALSIAQVPTRTVAGGRPLREAGAAAALLRVVEVGIGRVPLDGVVAAELLLGPYGGLDAVGLRRLKLALRAEELAGGGARNADALLAEALADSGRLATIDHVVGRRATRLAEVLAKLRTQAAAGSSAEELLWTAWDGSGVANPWREAALAAGLAAEEANRALDAVVALFAAARRFAERRPDGSAESFLGELLDAEVPEDTLAPASSSDAVLIATPSGLVGFEFDTVVVGGLQEGQWPNLRPRGSLLGAGALVELVTGSRVAGADERRAVLGDELRMLALAISRARSRVVLAAIESDDETASALFRLLAPDELEAEPPASRRRAPFTLRGMTGWLRRTLTASPSPADRADAAGALAALASEGVPGAHPSQWRGLAEVSTTAPLVDLEDPAARIRVSPSKITEVERSALEWFVAQMAGGDASVSMGFGTLVHDVLEHAEAFDVDTLWQALQARWGELSFESGWLAEQQLRRARNAIAALSEYLLDGERSGDRLVSAEQSFELDLAPAMLSGKIDRVEAHGDEIVIVDLKTGRVEGPKDTADHPQLGAYQLAYADGVIEELPEGHRPGGARLLFTREGQRGKKYTVRDQTAFSAEQLDAFRERIREAAARMVGPDFPAVVIDDPFAYGGDVRRVHLPDEVSSD